MKLTTITAAAYEPLTLAEEKEHLRVTSSDEDSYISSLIYMATEFVQNMTARKLITTTYELSFEELPEDMIVTLPKGLVQSITSVKYTDVNAAEQTFSDYYALGNDPCKVVFLSAPATKTDTADVIKIRWVSGYGAAEDVPEVLKVAMKLLVGQFYRNREATASSNIMALPIGLDRLIEQYRIMEFK